MLTVHYLSSLNIDISLSGSDINTASQFLVGLVDLFVVAVNTVHNFFSSCLSSVVIIISLLEMNGVGSLPPEGVPKPSEQAMSSPSSAKSPPHSLSSMTAEDIHLLLDQQLHSLSNPWDASIPFPVRIIPSPDADIASVLLKSDLEVVDLCDYLNGGRYPTSRLYFCPKTYPPPSNNDEMKGKDAANKCRGWHDLKRDIERAAHSAGSPILCNGSSSKGNANSRVFVCGHKHRTERSRAMEPTAEKPMRESSLVHDRKNNRVGGKGGKDLPRRRNTSRSKDGVTCKFSMTIMWDSHGFYVSLHKRAGRREHTGHPKPFEPDKLPFPSRLLTTPERKDMKHAVDVQQSKAAGRNFLLGKFNKYINSLKVNYQSQKMEGGDSSAKDDIATMLDNFETGSDIQFTCLSDMPTAEYLAKRKGEGASDIGASTSNSTSTTTVSTQKQPNGEITNENVANMDNLTQFEEAVKMERKERKLNNLDILFICIAWIYLPAFRFFMLCPEVIWCDVTSHSNNKGFHLLTFSCRTSINKQVIFMWIWIPNQQRFGFRWVFQHAIPTLISRFLRFRVKFIMKDGDPQQRNEILIALKRVFTNAIEGSCGFHIGKLTMLLRVCLLYSLTSHHSWSSFYINEVNMGWKAHVPGKSSITKKNQSRWLIIVKKIHRWIYSWMEPGYVMSEDEYKISKFLLLQFICSASVLSGAEGKMHMILAILRWLRHYVFVYEDLYLFYLRKNVRHFDTAHSSAHEVSCFGLR